MEQQQKENEAATTEEEEAQQQQKKMCPHQEPHRTHTSCIKAIIILLAYQPD